MSISAFFFAEGQQLDEEGGGGVKLLMKLLDKQEGTQEVAQIWCCQIITCVCDAALLSYNNLGSCNLKPLILSLQLLVLCRIFSRTQLKLSWSTNFIYLFKH